MDGSGLPRRLPEAANRVFHSSDQLALPGELQPTATNADEISKG